MSGDSTASKHHTAAVNHIQHQLRTSKSPAKAGFLLYRPGALQFEVKSLVRGSCDVIRVFSNTHTQLHKPHNQFVAKPQMVDGFI